MRRSGMKEKRADKLKRYDQIVDPSGTLMVLSVEKGWEVVAWCDLCIQGQDPKRVQRRYSPNDTITVF